MPRASNAIKFEDYFAEVVLGIFNIICGFALPICGIWRLFRYPMS